MKVSIITVCLNSGATIGDTLKSVASQTYKDIEYIVIDGFSSDKSVEILSSFKPVIDKLVIEPDDGIYDAMNKGLDLATGDLICFLNADDFYATELVIEQVVQKVREKKLNILFGDVAFVKGKICLPLQGVIGRTNLNLAFFLGAGCLLTRRHL